MWQGLASVSSSSASAVGRIDRGLGLPAIVYNLFLVARLQFGYLQ